MNLFFWGGTAFVRPYFVIYLQALGLATSEMAVILTVVPLLGLITSPLIGFAADKFQAHRLFLVMCLCIWVAGFEGLALIEPRTPLGRGNETDAAGHDESIETLHAFDLTNDGAFWLAFISCLTIEVKRRMIIGKMRETKFSILVYL